MVALDKGFLAGLFDDPAIREIITEQLSEFFDDELKHMLAVYSHNIFVGVVHAIRGPQTTQEARDFLMSKLTPEEQVAVMKVDLEQLKAQALSQEQLDEKLAGLGKMFGRLLVTVGKMYVPILP